MFLSIFLNFFKKKTFYSPEIFRHMSMLSSSKKTFKTGSQKYGIFLGWLLKILFFKNVCLEHEKQNPTSSRRQSISVHNGPPTEPWSAGQPDRRVQLSCQTGDRVYIEL